MKKKDFVTLILSTIGGILFALGMCMALLPEWGAMRQGIVIGVVGAVVLLAMVPVRRRMDGKPAIVFSGKAIGTTLLGIAGAIALGVGTVVVQLRVVQVVQDLHLEIRGEDVVEGRLDIFHEQGLDISLFEVVGTVEDKRIALDVHSLQFVEPGGDGGLRELALQLG